MALRSRHAVGFGRLQKRTNAPGIHLSGEWCRQSQCHPFLGTKSLAGHIPLYEGTTIAETAQFGYCYIIPYINSDSVVCGAIYYSMLIDSLPERVDVFPLSDSKRMLQYTLEDCKKITNKKQ